MPHIEILEKKFEFSPKIGVRSLPDIDRNHQSNRHGVYVVGDLADAPIIKVALQQGFDVAKYVCTNLEHRNSFDIDVVIIGAGPAGIGASLACKEHQKLQHAIIEKNRPFHTIQNFPKGKEIFAEPKERYKLLSQRYGGYWRFDSLVDFCYLVNPFFPPESLKNELKYSFNNLIQSYP